MNLITPPAGLPSRVFVAPPAVTVAPVPAVPAVDAKPPARTTFQRIEEEATDVLLALATLKPLRDFGYWLYSLISKPKATDRPLDNLGELTPQLLRGAQPTGNGYKQLKAQGVDTIINLRPEYADEAPAATAAGLKPIYLPLPGVGAPTNADALKFLSVVTDPANGKVFFHCQHGADRTGEMAAAYRIAVQGWSPDRAVAEMYAYRFHSGIQYEKQEWIYAFANYWATLPAAQRAAITHGANAALN